jgi:hypothetical protein
VEENLKIEDVRRQVFDRSSRFEQIKSLIRYDIFDTMLEYLPNGDAVLDDAWFYERYRIRSFNLGNRTNPEYHFLFPLYMSEMEKIRCQYMTFSGKNFTRNAED